MSRAPNLRITNHDRISPLTKKIVKPKCSAITIYINTVPCNHSLFSFDALTKDNER